METFSVEREGRRGGREREKERREGGELEGIDVGDSQIKRTI